MRNAHHTQSFKKFCTLAAAMTLAACGGNKSDSGDDGGGTTLDAGGSGDDATCGGTAPVITDVQCSASGLKVYEGDTELPTLLMGIYFEDEDQDLSAVSVELYADETVDGTVSTSSPLFQPVQVTLDEEECVTPEQGVNLTVFINGVDVRYNRIYEWAVVVRDANDTASEPFLLECISPYENGQEGNGEG